MSNNKPYMALQEVRNSIHTFRVYHMDIPYEKRRLVGKSMIYSALTNFTQQAHSMVKSQLISPWREIRHIKL